MSVLQIRCNEEVTRRVGDGTNTSGFAGTVEMCFATGPIGLRKYSTIMRCVHTKRKKKEKTGIAECKGDDEEHTQAHARVVSIATYIYTPHTVPHAHVDTARSGVPFFSV